MHQLLSSQPRESGKGIVSGSSLVAGSGGARPRSKKSDRDLFELTSYKLSLSASYGICLKIIGFSYGVFFRT